VRSLKKIPTWLRGTNFCINCTSWPCFAPSFMHLRNDPKYIPTLCNTPKHEFRIQWGRLSAFVAKNPDVTSWHKTLALIAPVHPVLHRVSSSYETIPNAAKYYATHENMSLGSNGVDWGRSLRKIRMWLRSMNYCVNCTSSHYFCIKFHVVTKRFQMHPNTIQCTKTWV
jgi:hypothetical protein